MLRGGLRMNPETPLPPPITRRQARELAEKAAVRGLADREIDAAAARVRARQPDPVVFSPTIAPLDPPAEGPVTRRTALNAEPTSRKETVSARRSDSTQRSEKVQRSEKAQRPEPTQRSKPAKRAKQSTEPSQAKASKQSKSAAKAASRVAPKKPRRGSKPTRASVGPRSRTTLAQRRGSVRAARAVRSFPKAPRRRHSAGSAFLSFGSMLIAVGILVGFSLPVNALINTSDAFAESGDYAPLAATTQALTVPAQAVDSVTTRDTFGSVSFSEVLALKYAGIGVPYDIRSDSVRWPFPNTVPTTDLFGPRGGGFHKGVDFAPGSGTPIYAIADGVAESSGYDNSGYGNHVVIQHNLAGLNIKTNYAHMQLDSSPIVAGQQIRVGDFLGLVGDTGIAYGPHLHFEIYVDDVPVDPLAWLTDNAVKQ